MVFPVEIVFKGRDFAVTESVIVPHGDAANWNDEAVRDVLVEILRAMGRVDDPATPADRMVVLLGFSWIVEPAERGVVIAIEIPMGAAVAGPFEIDQTRLDAMITRVVKAERQGLASSTVH